MRIIPKRFFLLFPLLLLLLPFTTTAQVTTRDDGTKTDSSISKKTKILVIPWEPRMYNCGSDISRAISSNTSQKFGQIEEALRKGMVDQLKRSFGSSYSVISLLDDTSKMKDLYFAYTRTTLSYTPVNFPLNPTKADSAKLKTSTGIQSGQVAVQSDDVEKFMNTVILHPNLLSYFKKKYNVDYVLFLNEIDLENDLGSDPYNTAGKTEFDRLVSLHWTMFNANDGKRVAMGKTQSKFSSETNTPKKIIDGAFGTISKAIAAKFTTAVKAKP